MEELARAVEKGSGLPEVVRIVARLLDGSLMVVDRRGTTVAVSARTAGEERALRSAPAAQRYGLQFGGERVGTVHARFGGEPDPGLWALLRALLAAELGRVEQPSRTLRRKAAALVAAIFGEQRLEAAQLRAQLRDLSLDEEGTVVVARVHPQSAVDEGRRERLLAACEQAVRASGAGGGAALREGQRTSRGLEVVAVVGKGELGARAAQALARELSALGLGGAAVVGFSRPFGAAEELPRAAAEALLAANVAEGEGREGPLDFDQTGAYRLLLPAFRENPAELERFYEETVGPLLSYDQQYETSLVATLEAYLECDGNVAAAAQRLYTHRHTVYYRLERIKELSGYDLTSSKGREQLSLGLKAMRVLGYGRSGPTAGVRGSGTAGVL